MVKTEWTPEELKIRKEKTISYLKTIGFDVEKFTCDDCKCKSECDWAYDAYNTDGDCLQLK